MNRPDDLAALDRQPADYVPRTRHLEPDGRPTYTNRLIHEASPYLRQHAHNPVDWWPWGDAAFAEAAERAVPVFLSVGYSTCHWCHVMEHESFEDPEIAAFLNAHFVPVKVDREERPDVDAVHMAFLQRTTGGGGWPMSVWLTPERRPLFAGTYFPPRDGDRGGMRGFLTLLRALGANWRDPALQQQAEPVLEALRQPTTVLGGALPDGAPLDTLERVYLELFDATWGGFGRAPKFPRPCVLEGLLRQGQRSGDARTLEAVRRTLERMHCGGMYDHVGGGFARYSVDVSWTVPHFEKMLYDNAQLVVAYLEGYQATGDDHFARVARDVLRYLDREMSHPDGGFYSATDADSADDAGHLHEGLFFTWTPAEIDAALPADDAAWVKATFNVRAGGNFEGRTVLHADRPLSPADHARWLAVREALYAVRAERPAPGLDDKILAAWNGLAISAFARASLVLGEPRFAERAARAADFVLTTLRDGARLRRSWRAGVDGPPAVLDDYAAMVGAALDLLEATGEVRWLDAALDLQTVLDAHFADAAGGYYRTPDDGEALLFREKPDYDGAEPSGNSLCANNLLRLAEITGDGAHRDRAEDTLRGFAEALHRAPHAMPKLCCALAWRHAAVRQVALVTPDAARPAELLAAAHAPFAPHKVVLWGPADGPLAERVPLFTDRTAGDAGALAYVCVGMTCDLPTADPERVARQVAGQ